MDIVKFKRIVDESVLPAKSTKGSAGFDIYSIEDITLKPGETYFFKTGWAMAIPEGFHAEIHNRSGLSSKYGIMLANCVAIIDSDYRGEVMVPLINNSSSNYVIHKKDRIAQILFYKDHEIELSVEDDLDITERGKGGFGSSGR